MDIASIAGLLLCTGAIVFGIISSAGSISGFASFIDVPSIIITIGGSFSAVLTSFSMANFIGGLKSFSLVLREPSFDVASIIQKIIDLSNIARKEGLLSLEEAAGELEDEFLKKGILLIVDGTDPELVRAIMETELVSMDDRHKTRIGFWESVSSMGPAWGMIGTLIGLILMLQDMNDPSSIGPSMAVALVTTLYGSLLANWICIPVASKLKANNSVEIQAKEIMIEGLLSIQAGENPRVIEEKLKSFLAPGARGVADDGGEADG